MTAQEWEATARTWFQASWMLYNYIFTADKDMRTDDYLYLFTANATYLLLWASLLFAICEFLRKCDDVPTELLSDANKLYHRLRKLRNAVFHIHRDLRPKSITKFLNDAEFTFDLIDFHHSFEEYFKQIPVKSPTIS